MVYLLVGPISPFKVPLTDRFMPVSLPIVDIQTAPRPAIEQSDTPSRGKYAFVSLGCPKNLVDSERMLGLLRDDGFSLVQDPEQSDFVVINTCGFIDNARQESLEAIDQMLASNAKAKFVA
jgi:ribosomal protein S12 methylthiotransferase